jgi:hypothetical protein
MKMATGGKCKVCKNFFSSMKGIDNKNVDDDEDVENNELLDSNENNKKKEEKSDT